MRKQETEAQSGRLANQTDRPGNSRPLPEEGVRLTRAFFNIGDKKNRERLIKLAEKLAKKSAY